MTEPTRRGPGARLAGGKYRLLRKLASGGMADVWVVRNEATSADVAVKLCASDRPDGGERLRHEARVGAMLSHRSVVRVYDLLEEPDGTLVLVMELLRGETLGHYLKARGALTAEEALAVLVPILSALDHAHSLGVVHRDVTPENIVLAVDPDGHVTPKLVDFGIAKVPSDVPSTLEGHVLGTPRYMAPERIRGGHETADARGDLFSVGVILCEALTGVSPFAASTPAASLAAVLERHVDPDPLVDTALWVEVQRAIAKRPYERHRTGSEMAEALLAATGANEARLAGLLRLPPSAAPIEARIASEPIATATHRASAAVARPSRRARIGLAAAVLLLALVGASLGVVGRERRQAGFVAASSSRSPPGGLSVASRSVLPEAPPAATMNDAGSRPEVAPTRPRSPATRPVPVRSVATTPGF